MYNVKLNAFLIETKALSRILKGIFNEIYLVKESQGTLDLNVLKGDSEEKLIGFPLPRNRSAAFLLKHIVCVFYFLKVSKRVHFVILSNVSDYPLTLLSIGKLTNKKIVDFIGGSRVFLSLVILHSKTSFLRKIASLYALISLNIALRISDKIILNARRLAREKPFIVYKDKVCVANNFPSEDFFEKFCIRKRFVERKLVVGYVGAFTLAKGICSLAKAMRMLLEEVPELEVIFVGDYQRSEPPVLGHKILHFFDEYRDRVTFTGQVHHSKVADYLNEMTLMIYPSYSEGLPHAIIEAMACGTPVLATPVGAIPDIIKDGETGFLLKSNDPKYIAERIVELLNQPELLEKVSINAYNYVRENFSYEKTLERWKKIINEL